MLALSFGPLLLLVMASTESGNSEGMFGGFAGWVHRNLLWLLVGSYLLAAALPGPGRTIRELTAGSGEATAVRLLLATLLFCAAAVVRWSQLRELLQRPGILLLSLIAIWLVPVLFVSALGWVLPSLFGETVTTGMLVGLALVAAMPVANSSVAWCQNAQGNVALGLGLIVLTIVLSPLAAPQMLNLMGLSLSQQETRQCEELITSFSGTFFIVWVILPSLLGMLANRLVGDEQIDRARSGLRLISAGALLTLNYASASLVMRDVFLEEAPQAILVSGGLAILLSALGIFSGWLLARLLSADRATTMALMFGFSMKHTGLALVLAVQVSHTERRVILMIVLATLLQHVVAGIADWYFSASRTRMFR